MYKLSYFNIKIYEFCVYNVDITLVYFHIKNKKIEIIF